MDEDLSDYDPGGIYPGQPSNNKSDWIQEYNRIPVFPEIAANSHQVSDDWNASELPKHSYPPHRKLTPIEELRESTDTEISDSDIFEDYDHQSMTELYDQMEFEWFEMKFSDEEARGVVNTAFDQYRNLQENVTERNGAIRTVTTPQTIRTEMSNSNSLTELSGEVTKSPGSYFNDKHGQDEDVFSKPKVDRLELSDKLPAQKSLPILSRPPSVPEPLAAARRRVIRHTSGTFRPPAVCQPALVPRPPKVPQPPMTRPLQKVFRASVASSPPVSVQSPVVYQPELVPRPPKAPHPMVSRASAASRPPAFPQTTPPPHLSEVPRPRCVPRPTTGFQPSEPYPSTTKADVFNTKYAFWSVSFQNCSPSVAPRPTVLPQLPAERRGPELVSRPTAVPRLPEVPRPTAVPRLPEVPRPTAVPRLPEVPRPATVPRLPEVPRPTAVPRLPEVPRPTAVPRLPEVPWPTAVPRLPEVSRPTAVPRLTNVYRPPACSRPPTIPQSTPPKRLPEIPKLQLLTRPPTVSQPPEPRPSSSRPDVYNKKYAFWTVKF